MSDTGEAILAIVIGLVVAGVVFGIHVKALHDADIAAAPEARSGHNRF